MRGDQFDRLAILKPKGGAGERFVTFCLNYHLSRQTFIILKGKIPQKKTFFYHSYAVLCRKSQKPMHKIDSLSRQQLKLASFENSPTDVNCLEPLQ